jgi:hypothetical protein
VDCLHLISTNSTVATVNADAFQSKACARLFLFLANDEDITCVFKLQDIVSEDEPTSIENVFVSSSVANESSFQSRVGRATTGCE